MSYGRRRFNRTFGISQYAANHGVTRVSSTLGMLLSAINADQFVSRVGTKSGTVRRGDFFLLDRSPGERFFERKPVWRALCLNIRAENQAYRGLLACCFPARIRFTKSGTCACWSSAKLGSEKVRESILHRNESA